MRIRKERMYLLEKISLKLHIVNMEFALNKDKIMRMIIDENILLKTENEALKSKNKWLKFQFPLFVGILLVGVFIMLVADKIASWGKDNSNSENIEPKSNSDA